MDFVDFVKAFKNVDGKVKLLEGMLQRASTSFSEVSIKL